MKIKFFCPRWGSEHLPWDSFFKKVKEAGYDGIEWAITASTAREEMDEVWELSAKQDLLLIAQHYDTPNADFGEHLQVYQAWLGKTRPYPWFKISSQTGKDFFSYGQNKQLIDLAGPGILHETHRGKFSFAAHITKSFLENMPDLNITFDVSHWINVAESFLEDQQEALQIAEQRTGHIHARVGFPEGPQVSDPGLGVWKQALDFHLGCWDRIVARNPSVSCTTEFGPFPYMAPGQDNQWEINTAMLGILRQRYSPAQTRGAV